jgi:FkbM family methyltransferase
MLGVVRRTRTAVRRIRAWSGSVGLTREVVPASLLAICECRPGDLGALVGRGLKRHFDGVRLHPRMLGGLSVAVDPTSGAEVMAYDELFIEAVYDLSRVPFTPEVVLDCGAFSGWFSLLAASRYPGAKIVAFEPHPANYARTRENLTANRLEIETRNEALSDTEGELWFTGSGMGGYLTTTGGEGDVAVHVVRFRDVVARLGSRRLLVKLDVEGEEERIVPDAVEALPQECAVFFETHRGEAGYRAVAEVFTRAGFRVEHSRTHGEKYFDAFAVRGA